MKVDGAKLHLEYNDCDEKVDMEKVKALVPAHISIIRCGQKRLHFDV